MSAPDPRLQADSQVYFVNTDDMPKLVLDPPVLEVQPTDLSKPVTILSVKFGGRWKR